MSEPATVDAAGRPLVDAPRAASVSLGAVSWRSLGRHGLFAIAPWVLLVLVVGLWQLAASLAWMPSQVLPAPSRVAQAFAEMVRAGDLQANVEVSLYRIGVGALIGVTMGLAYGVWLGCSATARAYLEPISRALFAVPSLGWIPILILVFGIDESLKVLIVAKAVLVPVVIATAKGIRDIPERYVEVARVMRLSRTTRLLKLTLPASLPTIVSGLRLGLSHAFIALIVVEMLAATEGLGYMMVWGRKLFQLDIVMASMIVVGVAGFALDRGLKALERFIMRWKPGHD